MTARVVDNTVASTLGHGSESSYRRVVFGSRKRACCSRALAEPASRMPLPSVMLFMNLTTMPLSSKRVPTCDTRPAERHGLAVHMYGLQVQDGHDSGGCETGMWRNNMPAPALAAA